MNRAVQDDDEVPEGFDALYEQSIDRVYSYARNRLGPSEGEDVASEVFLAAYVALRGGQAEAVTEAWLMAVARNKVIDRWRAAERRMNKRHLLRRPTFERGPDAGWTEASGRLDQAMDRLSVRHRALLMLHYVDGFPMKDVAEQLGMSIEAARSGIARARRALLGEYQEVTANA